MATTKPRITVTLEPRVYEVLKAISASTNESMSSFIGDLLETNLPVFERMAVMFQRIAQHKEKQKQEIADGLEDAQEKLEPILEQVLSQFDFFMDGVEETIVGKAGDRASGALHESPGLPTTVKPKRTAKKAAATPPSNRGVRSDHKTAKTVNKSKG